MLRFSVWFVAFLCLWNTSFLEAQEPDGLHFKIQFDPATRSQALTGRVYVAISRYEPEPERDAGQAAAENADAPRRRPRTPIQQVGETGVPLFGRNVEQLAPGQWSVIDSQTLGHPLASLSDLPEGEYWVQAFINVYTRCERADGKTLWVHLDQGEGQNWRRSPGNLTSQPQRIQLNAQTRAVELTCDQLIPPVEPIADSEYVKRIRIKSEKLSAWWGQPIYLGATILLPQGYTEHPESHYPVNYVQGHFSRRAPGGYGSRGEFGQRWRSEEPQPRFIYVTFQHPSPFYDDSYAVNSANNGPYGDAILEELIPAVESQFRIIQQPWARQLSGGSTGGWIALALQVFHPDFFGGCWASAPDSPDFRYHQLIDIYHDDNAYFLNKAWTRVERPTRRRTDGNVEAMMKDENHFELVVGDRSRSGGQWDIWEATFGPCAQDGYPQRLWDKYTGEIDPEVADYWREHFDLRYLLERDWATLGPKLQNKLHLYCGDMDNYYLNNGLRKLEEFLLSATEPKFEGVIKFQPLARHVWGPGAEELQQLIDAHLRSTAPEGTDFSPWNY